MGGGGDIPYESVLMLAVFFAAQWYLSRVASAFHVPTIPCMIIVGLVFGPNGLDLIGDFSHTYSPLQLLGFIGVGLVIFESGMHLDVTKVFNWDVGPHMVIVACLGTFLPIALGMGFMVLLGSEAYPNGLAAGFSLAPTSVGISLTLLSQAKQLNSRVGQIIMSSAFLDDIFSIICLVVMINLASGAFDPVPHVIIPMISSFGLVGFGVVGSVYMPQIMPLLTDTQNAVMKTLTIASRSMPIFDELIMAWQIILYLLLSWLGDVIGSSLLGCFTAGMLFSRVPRAHIVWERQFKRISSWLLRIFFSCTVAFTIKIDSLISGEAFWKGLIIAAVPCLLSKLVSGFFVGEERWVVGVAMMARGEFAYLVAESAYTLERLTDMEYSIVVWALLWATMLSPIMFGVTLNKYTEQKFLKDHKRSKRIGGKLQTGVPSFIVHFFSAHQTGMVRDFIDALHAAGLDVRHCRTENHVGFCNGTFEVFVRQALVLRDKFGTEGIKENERALMKYKMATDLDDEKLNEICHVLQEHMQDPECKIIFEPYMRVLDPDADYKVKIDLFGFFGEDYKAVKDQVQEYLSGAFQLVMIKSEGDIVPSENGERSNTLHFKQADAVAESSTTTRASIKAKRESMSEKMGVDANSIAIGPKRNSFFNELDGHASFYDCIKDGDLDEDDEDESDIYENRRAVIRLGVEKIFERNDLDGCYVRVFVSSKYAKSTVQPRPEAAAGASSALEIEDKV